MKHSLYPSLSALALVLGTLTMVGCGGAVTFSNPKSTDTTTPPAAQMVAGPAVSGSVYGGHAPLEGAHVYLLQPGTTGYGSAATSLLGSGTTTSPYGYTLTANGATSTDPNVPVGAMYETSDASGGFNFTGAYQCAVGRPVYIYAWGGKISATALNNNNIVQLATLGNCPSNGSFSGSSALQYVYLNEVSTVATAYTFQPFTLVGNNNAWDIGTSNTTQGLLGIANAANTAAQLYDIQGGTQLSTATGEGEGHVANFQTQLDGVPNQGNGVVPQATLDSLANIAAACVDSAPTAVGTTTTTCNSLFNVATDNGETTGTKPVDTGTALINIARFPAGNNSATAVDATYAKDIFSVPTSTVPYLPALSNAPNDWTIVINYPDTAVSGYPTATNNTLGAAESIAVDNIGQVFVTAQTGFFINRFSPLGARNSLNTLTYIPGYVSVDGSNNGWTGNANCGTGNTACPTGTPIFEAGSNGVFSTTFGSGYQKAYTVITDKSNDVFFFALNSATTPNYDMFEYATGGSSLNGPFNINPTTSSSTTNYTATLDILGATETSACIGLGCGFGGGTTTYTYTFNFTPVGGTAAVPLAVGDVVPISLTNDPGTGTTPVAATGWSALTSVTVASVNSTTNPTSFTATGTKATTDTVSTNTNGSAVMLNITKATETNHTTGGITTYTYTFTFPAAGGPPVAVGDTVALSLADAGTGSHKAMGWETLTSVKIATVNSTTNPTSFTATGTTPVTDSTNGSENGATGTGTYYVNGASGTGTYPYSVTTTTTTPGAIPAGDNVGHGAIDASGDLWITAETPGNTIARVTPTGTPLFTSIVTSEQPEFPAIDHSGNAWIAVQETASAIYEVSPTGGTTILTAGGAGGTTATGALMTSTFGSAIDGNGNIWFANRSGNYGSVSGVAGTNTLFVINGGVTTPGTANNAISPPTNYIPEAQYPATATTFTKMLNDSLNVAIDPSGNVWVTNYLGSAVVEVVGAAAPVVTPLSVAAGNNQLGQKP